MALNLEMVGQRFEPYPFKYDRDQVILYALGIGGGVDELDFVYEKNLRVYPTFAVVPLITGIIDLIGKLNINLLGLLHGEQKIVVHKPIPPQGTVYTSSFCRSIYDKGDKGAICHVEFETRDENSELLFENFVVLFDRTAGNFGGEPGPKPERVVPPEGVAPDFRVVDDISPNQAALYRLTGDKNPLHIDPDFARKGGLKKPILHGLCTYGFAGRAVLKGACGGDPARFRSLGVRFMNVVYPGETLITEGWKSGKGRYIIRTKTGDDRVVLGNAVAEVDKAPKGDGLVPNIWK